MNQELEEEEEEEEEEKEEKEEKSDSNIIETTETDKDDPEIFKETLEPVSEAVQIKTLLTEINRLNGLVSPIRADVKKAETDDKKIKDEVYDFIKDVDMDDLASNPVIFNQVLHEVIKRVQKQTTEQVLLNIPDVVMSQVKQQSFVKQKSDRFYSDNPDLVNVRSVVKACAEQLQQDNPEWGIDKIFKNTAAKTRETLGMSANTVNTNKEIASVEDVAFAGSKGSSKNNLKRKKSSLQRELDEL